MKITRRIISLLLTIVICMGMFPAMMIPVNAEPVSDEVSATVGQTVTVQFQYRNINGIQGNMTLSNPDLFTDSKVTVTKMDGSYKYKKNVISIFYYGSSVELCTVTVTLTLSEKAKPGDQCVINFEYETSVPGIDTPSIPDYQYDVVTVTVGVDYSALQAQINRANALMSKEKEYTAASWSKMLLALSAARKALLSNDQSEVDSATQNLKTAIDSLVKAPIDYTELKKQIKIAEELTKADYTASSWNKMTAALTKARSALTAKDQKTVDTAATNLKKAIDALVKVSSLDYTELRRQIARAETLVESDYTAESWAEFVTALQSARNALNVTEQSQIDAAANNLKIAIESLVREIRLDYSRLTALIAEAEGLKQGDYTSASWKSLLAALDKAREALNSPVQSEVDAAVTALQTALDNLVSMNFAELLAAIESVKKYAQDERLAELWMQMHELLLRAEELMTAGDQAAVDQCAKDIVELLAKIIEEMNKLKTVEIIEVEKNDPTPENFCNITMHRVWPILFWISLALNIALVALIIIYLVLKRKRVSDDTPLVDYSIEDDELE